MATQDNWRCCHQCQGLFFAGNHSQGSCPNAGLFGGPHSFTGSSNYKLVHNTPSGGQENWRWCNKCQGLFFAGNSRGRCPAGGTHSPDGSGRYTLFEDAGPGQNNWRRCNKCQGLFFAGNSPGHCPAGEAHSLSGSGNYRLAAGLTIFPLHGFYLITWQSFNGQLQDDCDMIQLSVTPSASVPELVLRTGPGITARKQIKIVFPDGHSLHQSTAGENQETSPLLLTPDSLASVALVFGKQKLNPFGSDDMYQLSSLEDGPVWSSGRNVRLTFNWVRDHC
ncbi:MAG TPA: hypothetical protein VF723_15295 [Pyrinomonadaceae bacterium]|jgi:hypothetical protein